MCNFNDECLLCLPNRNRQIHLSQIMFINNSLDNSAMLFLLPFLSMTFFLQTNIKEKHFYFISLDNCSQVQCIWVFGRMSKIKEEKKKKGENRQKVREDCLWRDWEQQVSSMASNDFRQPGHSSSLRESTNLFPLFPTHILDNTTVKKKKIWIEKSQKNQKKNEKKSPA